jgi:hypothetical protein
MRLNHYLHGPDVAMLGRIYAIAHKPIFIGEYGHNSLDEGLLTTAVPVASAAERAHLRGARWRGGAVCRGTQKALSAGVVRSAP